MKPAAFRYLRAGSLEEACQWLDGHEDCMLLAGGQSLVPLMAMRLAQPAVLIDIHALEELRGIRCEDGSLVIRAVTTQAEAQRSGEVRDRVPLLARALPHVGHMQTRNRGTVGGSLAFADPAAEIPLVAATLGATISTRSVAGEKRTAARDFLLGPMTTGLAAGDCVTGVAFPVWPGPRLGSSFQEVAVRHSDFALVAVAAQVALAGDGRCERVALGIGGVADAPVVCSEQAAGGLLGERLTEGRARAVAEGVAATLAPETDLHATADYRRRVAGVLLRRALLAAREEALGGSGDG